MTPSLLKCLLAILTLSNRCKTVISKDVAHLLGIKRSSVHRTLLVLQEKGYISKRPYGDISLTPEGLAAANAAAENRDAIALLLTHRCGLPTEEAVNAAIVLICELRAEHLPQFIEGLKN